MPYIFHEPTGEIIDDDGQVVATLSDNALPEQGESLVRAYNSDVEARGLPEEVLLQLRTPVLIRGQRRSTETAFPLTMTKHRLINHALAFVYSTAVVVLLLDLYVWRP